MKKTIKEDNNRKILKTEYLNDNSLLEYVEENEMVHVTIRFVEGQSIKVQTLCTMSKEDYNAYLGSLIVKSENNEAIAIFRRENDKFFLQDVYEITTRQPSVSDFLDLSYRKYFGTGKKPYQK